MEIILSFNSKVSSPNRKPAIEIAKSHDNELKNDIYSVKFNDIDKDFLKLLDLVSGWNSANLLFDGKEVDIRNIHNLLCCGKEGGEYGCYKGKRAGECKMIPLSQGFRFRDLASLKKEIKEAQINEWSGESFVKDFEIDEPEFIIKKGNNEFELNKEYLKKYVKDKITENFLYLCPFFKEDDVFKLIDSLPINFKIKTKEVKEVLSEEEEEKQKEEDDKKYLKQYEEMERQRMEIRLKLYEEEVKKRKEIEKKIEGKSNERK